MFGAYAIALYISLYLACSLEYIAIVLVGWLYIVIDGAKQSFLARTSSTHWATCYLLRAPQKLLVRLPRHSCVSTR